MSVTPLRPFFLPLAALLLLVGCSPIELTSVVDTQFLLTNRELPFNSMIVVYDTKDLALKQEFEYSFLEYLRGNSAVQAHADIDLYSPLKQMEEKEKTWALRDNKIVAVLYFHGGGSGRSLRDWLLPEAGDIDISTAAWKSGAAKVFVPSTGQVVWAGNVAERGAFVGAEMISDGFYSAVVSDLLRRGFLEAPRVENPAMRGFNR